VGAPIRILHLEDDLNDAGFIRQQLAQDGLTCELVCVETREEFLAALEQGGFDLIFADYKLPGFDGREALALARERAPLVPFIFISGTMGEEAAIAALKQGATDYLIKGWLKRLGAAVRRALEETAEHTRRLQAEADFQRMTTQLEAAHAQLTEVVRQMPAGVIIAEASAGRLVLGNEQAAQIWRHPFLPSKNIHAYAEYKGFHADGRPYEPEEWPLARALLSGEVVTDEEIVIQRGDGTRGVVLVNAAPVRDSAGQITAGVVTFVDITERKRAEEEREKLLRQEEAARASAEAANRLKDEFLAIVSHELRTPLNSIYGWAELLCSGQLSVEQTRQAVEAIARNAKVQKQIIEDLLDVSRIITGKLRLNAQEVALPDVIRATIETIRHAAEAKNIHLLVAEDIGAEQDTKVTGDFDRLQQVVWNLLSNAIKFTPPGGHVWLTLTRLGSSAQIIVRDTGKGIKPEFLPYVFDRFRQEDASPSRQQGGLGLGLAIVRQLVELHHGTVQVKSPGEGRGASFTVTLPLRETSFIPPGPASGTSALSGPSAVEITGVRVLAVEDEPDACELIRLILESSGAEVRTARSAAEGYAVLDEWKPDLILADIGMPHEDGYDFIRRVRAREVERGGLIPAVALTAYSRTEDRVQALAAGYQMHVVKPVEPQDLLLVVASLTGRLGPL
jgi:signal transduction histidine kinase